VLTTETFEGVATPVTGPLEPALLEEPPLQPESSIASVAKPRASFVNVEKDVMDFMALSL
jgi:hypothetical protein